MKGQSIYFIKVKKIGLFKHFKFYHMLSSFYNRYLSILNSEYSICLLLPIYEGLFESLVIYVLKNRIELEKNVIQGRYIQVLCQEH